MKKPDIDQPLIDYLDPLFPDRLPTINLTDREIWIKVGERNVVNLLISLKKDLDEFNSFDDTN